jgi:DnaJ-class molecular chaperone
MTTPDASTDPSGIGTLRVVCWGTMELLAGSEASGEEGGVRPCRRCGGNGIDPDYRRRYTTGGHDERPCRDCGGTGEREPEPDEETTAD